MASSWILFFSYQDDARSNRHQRCFRCLGLSPWRCLKNYDQNEIAELFSEHPVKWALLRPSRTILKQTSPWCSPDLDPRFSFLFCYTKIQIHWTGENVIMCTKMWSYCALQHIFTFLGHFSLIIYRRFSEPFSLSTCWFCFLLTRLCCKFLNRIPMIPIRTRRYVTFPWFHTLFNSLPRVSFHGVCKSTCHGTSYYLSY